jgi:ankyrin repeat protein
MHWTIEASLNIVSLNLFAPAMSRFLQNQAVLRLFVIILSSTVVAGAADDRARIRQAVVSGKSEDLRTLLQFPSIKPLISKRDDNDFLYLAIEQVFPYRFNGYDVSPEELERSLSVDARQAEILRVLLENGATVSVNGAQPRPPALIHAVRLRARQCVEVLLNADANPNVMDNGYRPLPMAAKNGATAPEIVRLLLDAKADPNGGDKENGYPLVAILDNGDWNHDAYEARREKIPGRYEALRTNSKKTVEMLLQAGADASVGLQVTLLHEKPAAADSELIPLFSRQGVSNNPVIRGIRR